MPTSYTINFADTNKTGFTINAGEFDGPQHYLENPPTQSKIHSGLHLMGRGTLNYGEAINENFLHLLEHFARPIPPVYPIEGQLWADTTGSTNILKFVDVENKDDATPLTVSSITRSGSVATVVTSTVHGLVNADTVVIAGATQPEYNGTFIITYVNTTTFTYKVEGTPATPATGTITCKTTHWAEIPLRNPVTPVTGDFRVQVGQNFSEMWTNSAWGIVWTSTNDGTGSGLDADLLDGYHASDFNSFYVLKGGDTMTGYLTLHAEPSANRHAATKFYVDSHVTSDDTAMAGLGDIHVNLADRTLLNLLENPLVARPIASAWVTFDGTNGASPVIKRAYKVATVTRNGSKEYTVAFDTDVQTQLATVGSTAYAVVTGVGGTDAALTTATTKPTVGYYNMSNVGFKMFAEIDYGSGSAEANRISAAVFA